MKPENRNDRFFQKSAVEMSPCFYSLFPEGKREACAVGGIVVRTEGSPRGVFVGSRVAAFTSGEKPERESTLRLPPDRVFPLPDDIDLKSAAAAAKYLDRLNALRECAAPLCSGYALTKPDEAFRELLDAMGFFPAELSDADLIIDTDGSLVNGAKQGVRLLCWHQMLEGAKTAPGADWELLIGGDQEQVKYSEAYVPTRVADNLKTYLTLITHGRLKPDVSDVITLDEEPERKTKGIARELSAFHPFEDLIVNRRKPMFAVCAVGNGSRSKEETIELVDSVVGFEHTVRRELEKTLKLGYPDGSTADILRIDGQAEHIELHFDGVTITRVNGTVKKY